MNLFVIGNGFDLAHGLPTSYKHFRDYLLENEHVFLDEFERLFGYYPESKREAVEKCLWRDFETNLGEMDDSQIIDNGTGIDMGLESGDVGIEDTLDSYWKEQYDFLEDLNEHLFKWVRQIDINVPPKTKFINSNDENLFFTFNYTKVLEEVYSVDEYAICHIHGDSDNEESEPIIGHGNKEKINEYRAEAARANLEYLEKYTSIYNALADSYERTLKDVDRFIKENRRFFSRLFDYQSVIILGTSLGAVDIPYIEKIKESISPYAKWTIFYYSESEIEGYRATLENLGIEKGKINFYSTEEFYM